MRIPQFRVRGGLRKDARSSQVRWSFAGPARREAGRRAGIGIACVAGRVRENTPAGMTPSMTTTPAPTTRWGLLLTTLLLGVALVATGVATYLDARGSASSTARVEASDLLQIRHDLRDAGSVDVATLERLLEQARPRGARYLAVVARDGVIGAAGTPGAEVTWQAPGPEERTRAGPPREADPPHPDGNRPPRPEDGDRPPRPGDDSRPPRPEEAARPPRPRDDVRPPRPKDEASQLRPDGAHAPPLQRLAGTSLFRAIAWLEPPPDPRRGLTPDDRRGPLAPDRAILVVDFEPVIASRMVSRALLALTAQGATAVILLLAAVSSWRTSRREEVARQEAERDRHLRTLGEMSAVLGHELRNPLTSLKGHAQLLLERLPADHAGHAAAGTIVGEAVRLEALANQVLEFVKTGALDIRDEDPKAAASEAMEICGLDNITLSLGHVPATWPMDRSRLVPVLVNLLKNAREASSTGDPVELRLAAEHGRLVFEVLDRGEGLTPGEESRAFEPFFTTRVHGTGLGLALARRVVEGHGGAIRAANRPGGGASFQIALPRRAASRTA